MPKVSSKPTVAKNETGRPYPAPSSSPDNADSKDEIIPKEVKTNSRGGKGSVWTAAELKQLLHFALNRNGRGWGEAVPGKTAKQASTIWANRILPYLEKALEERAK